MSSRALLLAALVLTATVALGVMYEEYGTRDRARAVLATRTARFAGTTRSRIGTWLKAHRPQASIRWSASGHGPFNDRYDVDLELGTKPVETYRFLVYLKSRRVEPRDPATRALIEDIKRWARK